MTPEAWRYDTGYPDVYMAQMYNASDVVILNSKREGFGIPLIEAQACGVPVITCEWASQPELVRWGDVIPPLDLEWCGLGSWQAIPNAHLTMRALEERYDEWKATRSWDRELRLDAEAKIHRDYSWDVLVRDYWHPLLTRLANGHDLLGAQPSPDIERHNGTHARSGISAVDGRGDIPSPEPSIAELVS
jgi:glycosyltransferase involved in cell wall biosynthesis